MTEFGASGTRTEKVTWDVLFRFLRHSVGLTPRRVGAGDRSPLTLHGRPRPLRAGPGGVDASILRRSLLPSFGVRSPRRGPGSGSEVRLTGPTSLLAEFDPDAVPPRAGFGDPVPAPLATSDGTREGGWVVMENLGLRYRPRSQQPAAPARAMTQLTDEIEWVEKQTLGLRFPRRKRIALSAEESAVAVRPDPAPPLVPEEYEVVVQVQQLRHDWLVIDSSFQLRHRFGTSFRAFSAPAHPTLSKCRGLLIAHADSELPGACNPLLYPIRGCRTFSESR